MKGESIANIQVPPVITICIRQDMLIHKVHFLYSTALKVRLTFQRTWPRINMYVNARMHTLLQFRVTYISRTIVVVGQN